MLVTVMKISNLLIDLLVWRCGRDNLCIGMPQYHSCTSTGTVNTCAVVYDKDADFGRINVIEPPQNESKDVGSTVEQLPSRKLPPEALAHLSNKKQKQLLAVLDKIISRVFL